VAPRAPIAGCWLSRPERTRMAVILIVEDDVFIRQLAESMVEEWGHNQLSASDVDQALSHLRSSQHIDALFTDIRLKTAALGGYELAHEAIKLRPKLRVLYAAGSPHMLRHACVYTLANKGHDTRALQRLPRPPEHSTHRALHRVIADTIQGLLACLASQRASGARRSDPFAICTAKHKFAFLRTLPRSFRSPVKQNFLQISYCSIHGCNEVNFAVGYFVAAVVTQPENFGAHSPLPESLCGRMRTSG